MKGRITTGYQKQIITSGIEGIRTRGKSWKRYKDKDDEHLKTLGIRKVGSAQRRSAMKEVRIGSQGTQQTVVFQEEEEEGRERMRKKGEGGEGQEEEEEGKEEMRNFCRFSQRTSQGNNVTATRLDDMN